MEICHPSLMSFANFSFKHPNQKCYRYQFALNVTALYAMGASCIKLVYPVSHGATTFRNTMDVQCVKHVHCV